MDGSSPEVEMIYNGSQTEVAANFDFLRDIARTFCLAFSFEFRSDFASCPSRVALFFRAFSTGSNPNFHRLDLDCQMLVRTVWMDQELSHSAIVTYSSPF